MMAKCILLSESMWDKVCSMVHVLVNLGGSPTTGNVLLKAKHFWNVRLVSEHGKPAQRTKKEQVSYS